jgi:hypothetical protein
MATAKYGAYLRQAELIEGDGIARAQFAKPT